MPLTRGQQIFRDVFASKTGLNRRLIGAWLLAEEGGEGGPASGYERQGYFNYLNIARTDSNLNAPGSHGSYFKDPRTAAEATAAWIKGKGPITKSYGPAAAGIQAFGRSGGQSLEAQIHALSTSGWASSGYKGGSVLRTLLREKQGGATPVASAPDRPLPQQRAAAPASSAAAIADTQGNGSVLELLKAFQDQQKPQVSSGGLQTPAFAAAPPVPGGGGISVPTSSSAPAAKPDISKLLSLVATAAPGGSAVSTPAVAAGAPTAADPGTSAGPEVHATATGGKVVLAPGANRPGVGLTPGILHVVRILSAQAGHPITVGTGTNHDRLTVNGNVSDHYAGNATDIPARNRGLIRLGQQALIAFGMNPAQARKIQGGLFNLPYGKHRRIQIIFNTQEGGDHTDHLHVGVTALGAHAR